MTQTPDAASPARRSIAPVAAAVAVMAIGLGLFDYFSAGSKTAQRALIARKPPVYGRFEPGFAKIGVLALVLAVAAGAFAFVVARAKRDRPVWIVAGAVCFLVAFAASVAVVNGSTKAYTDPLERKSPVDYQADVHFVRELGVRTFIREHPKLLPGFASVHSRTHPPGPVVLLSVLRSVFPRHLVPRAVVLAILSALVLVPAWFLTTMVYGRRAAVYAVLLLAVAPAPVLFGFTSMDAVYATLLAATGVLLFFAVGSRGSPRAALVAGVIAGSMTIMSYGVVFVTAAALVYAFLNHPPKRAAARLAVAGAGGLVALLVMRVFLGFDLIGSFRAGYKILADESERSYLYWIFGNPAVWLTFAGLPIAALSVRELIEHRPKFLIALFVPLVLINFNHKFSAETERIGQFAYPFIAAAAAGWLARWEGDRPRPHVIGVLVSLCALQAVLLEALYYTYW